MAAPTPVVRQIPTGYKMPDGYKALVTLQNLPAINIWEKEVTPPGLDGGPKIDTTTMHNVKYRTSAPRALVTVDDGAANCAYDPDVLADILVQINVPQSITFRYQDGTTYCMWGFLGNFKPQGLVEGQMPMAQATFASTNWDFANKVEAGPVLTPASGT